MAVALFFGGVTLIFVRKHCFVMALDELCCVAHGAVTYFDSVPVEYLVEGVILGEFFCDDFEKFLSDVRGQIFAVGGVVPN